MAKNLEAVEFIQDAKNFSLPLDELDSAMRDGRFHHDGNELSRWCFSNVVGKPVKKGMIAPIKQKPHQKIDGAIATVMAFSRACSTEIAEKKQYQLIIL